MAREEDSPSHMPDIQMLTMPSVDKSWGSGGWQGRRTAPATCLTSRLSMTMMMMMMMVVRVVLVIPGGQGVAREEDSPSHMPDLQAMTMMMMMMMVVRVVLVIPGGQGVAREEDSPSHMPDLQTMTMTMA